MSAMETGGNVHTTEAGTAGGQGGTTAPVEFTAGGVGFRLRAVRGEVLDFTKVMEPLIDMRGYGITVEFKTKAQANLDLWLRDRDGREVPVLLKDADIPVRVGHDLTVLLAGRPDWDYELPSAVVDHSIGRTYRLAKPNDFVHFLRPPILARGWLAFLLGAAAAGGAALFQGALAGLMTLAAAVAAGWFVWSSGRRRAGAMYASALDIMLVELGG
jgi:hypothetical protein